MSEKYPSILTSDDQNGWIMNQLRIWCNLATFRPVLPRMCEWCSPVRLLSQQWDVIEWPCHIYYDNAPGYSSCLGLFLFTYLQKISWCASVNPPTIQIWLWNMAFSKLVKREEALGDIKENTTRQLMAIPKEDLFWKAEGMLGYVCDVPRRVHWMGLEGHWPK